MNNKLTVEQLVTTDGRSFSLQTDVASPKAWFVGLAAFAGARIVVSA